MQHKKGISNSVADYMYPLATGNGATGKIKEEIRCSTTEDKEVVVEEDEEVDELDWIELEDEEEELLTTSPDRYPTMASSASEELLKEQATDEKCIEIMVGINQRRGGAFETNTESLIVRKVENEAKIGPPEIPRKRVLYTAHYPVTSAHPGGRTMYRYLRRNF